ncbi:hypothetical protein ES703_78228 [subsurface metagenome]
MLIRRLMLIYLFSFYSINLFPETSILDDFQGFVQGNRTKYTTAGNPKAQGLEIQIEFPKSWVQKEGKRPHIVQNFSSSAKGGVAKVATLSINPIPSDLRFFTDEEIADVLFDTEFAKDVLPEGSQLLIANPTKYDGEPGIFLYFITQTSRAGANLLGAVVSHRFIYQRNAVDFSITYSILVTSNTKQLTQQEVEAFLGLAIQMGNSIIILNKY